MKTNIFILLLLFSASLAFASTVDTLVVYSKSMKKDIRNIVITPEAYGNQTALYPVVYMLHGATDDYRFWPRDVPKVSQFADKYNVILVFPDGDKTSWYFDSTVDEKSQYETYISMELVDVIDKKYRTVADRTGRAITGLSMGGHGAFYLAFKHPEVWGAAGSTSGGMDIRPFPDNWEIAKRLGSYKTHPENWEQNTVINMVSLLKRKSVRLIFDCGVDDFFYGGNRQLHLKLLEEKIPHHYISRPGGHTLDYWLNSIEYHFLFFNDYFELMRKPAGKED